MTTLTRKKVLSKHKENIIMFPTFIFLMSILIFGMLLYFELCWNSDCDNEAYIASSIVAVISLIIIIVRLKRFSNSAIIQITIDKLVDKKSQIRFNGPHLYYLEFKKAGVIQVLDLREYRKHQVDDSCFIIHVDGFHKTQIYNCSEYQLDNELKNCFAIVENEQDSDT